ncbi:MAG: protein translocase subunit SecD [Coriobacteriia bacterium]|nr:protein translocase subunit SecD [Coriobacteriia bacterium]
MDPKQRNMLSLVLVAVLVAIAWWLLLPWRGPDRLIYSVPDPENPGQAVQETYELANDPVYIGPSGDVSVPSTEAVAMSAVLERSPGDDGREGASDWVVRPSEETTAALDVNGVSVESTRLVDADRLRMGGSDAQFRLGRTSISLGLDIQGGLQVILTAEESSQTAVTADVMDRAELIVRNRIDRLGASEVNVQRQGSDSLLVELPGIKDPQEALDTLGQTGQLEIRDVVSQDETGNVTLGPVLLTGEVITDANITVSEENPSAFEVNVIFNAEGSAKWAEITGARVGRPIAIVLDGQVQSAPVVQERISGGQTRITGNFTGEEAKRLKTVLETGALPVTLEMQQSQVVGPTLGQDSLNAGVLAALYGLIIVAMYMALMYRGLGVVSWLSLLIFASLFLGVLALLSTFGLFALSLAGIAGIVLTIGLAADSSILIFERFKEEVRMGKTFRSAAKSGTKHAILTSLDADLVTFVSALVLYTVAIGPVRGFALTLMIGITIDLTVAFLFTRTMVILLAESVVARVPVLFGMKGGDEDA